MTYIIPLAIIGVFLVIYLVYMKFYFPKMQEKYKQLDNEFNQEWNQNKEAVLSEYLDDPNKFGLISEVTEGEKIIGMLSSKGLPDSLKNKAKEAVIGAITFTSKVDMSLYYLVATDKALHYTGFDGEKCFVHEIFDYNQISERNMTKNKFSFLYKNEKISFPIEEILVGYPRFNVHEFSQTPTSNNRATNYFVREFLAYEITNNLEYKNAKSSIPKMNTDMLKASKEQVKDTKIRTYFIEQFKQKLGVRG